MISSRYKILLWVTITHKLLPLVLVCSLAYLGTYPLTIVVPSIALIGIVLYTLFRIGMWQYTNYYIRYLIIIAYMILAIYCILQVTTLTNNLLYEYIIMTSLSILIICLLVYNTKIFRATKKPERCIKLLFPFKSGRYLVTNGGDGKICREINYYHTKKYKKIKHIQTARRYAVDAVLIEKNGRTTQNLLTDDNRDYKIFHEQIYSPCGGKVIKVVNDAKTHSPFEQTNRITMGNYLVIKKGEYEILVGNFEKNTIKVKVGDKVSVGQFIGIVGNSKTLSTPHIHIQAYKPNGKSKGEAEGIPIIFNGHFYGVKNKIIKVR